MASTTVESISNAGSDDDDTDGDDADAQAEAVFHPTENERFPNLMLSPQDYADAFAVSTAKAKVGRPSARFHLRWPHPLADTHVIVRKATMDLPSEEPAARRLRSGLRRVLPASRTRSLSLWPARTRHRPQRQCRRRLSAEVSLPGTMHRPWTPLHHQHRRKRARNRQRRRGHDAGHTREVARSPGVEEETRRGKSR